jgi:hypothetical protein
LLCGMDYFSDVVKWKFLFVFFSKKKIGIFYYVDLVLGCCELATDDC